MLALGQKTSRTTTTGHVIISLLVKTETGNKRMDWCLGNSLPEGCPEWGVFEYVPEDQFCYWRDVGALSRT